MRLIVWPLLVAAVACGRGGPLGSSAPLPDLTGRWRGEIQIARTGLPTPLDMTLVDEAGRLHGTGGGVDCRYFFTCGSFHAYAVSGTQDGVRIVLNGVTSDGRGWTLEGTLTADTRGASGTGSGTEFEPSAWRMSRQ